MLYEIEILRYGEPQAASAIKKTELSWRKDCGAMVSGLWPSCADDCESFRVLELHLDPNDKESTRDYGYGAGRFPVLCGSIH